MCLFFSAVWFEEPQTINNNVRSNQMPVLTAKSKIEKKNIFIRKKIEKKKQFLKKANLFLWTIKCSQETETTNISNSNNKSNEN